MQRLAAPYGKCNLLETNDTIRNAYADKYPVQYSASVRKLKYNKIKKINWLERTTERANLSPIRVIIIIINFIIFSIPYIKLFYFEMISHTNKVVV